MGPPERASVQSNDWPPPQELSSHLRLALPGDNAHLPVYRQPLLTVSLRKKGQVQPAHFSD